MPQGAEQGGNMKLQVFIFSFFLSLTPTITNAATPAKIISIPRGAPVFVADGVKTTAIARGMAANDPARVVTQLVKKKNFLKHLRPGMIKAINPWYIASMVASGFIVMALEGLQEDLYKPLAGSSYDCVASGGAGYPTISVTSAAQCYDYVKSNFVQKWATPNIKFEFTPMTEISPMVFNFNGMKIRIDNGQTIQTSLLGFKLVDVPQEIEYGLVSDEELYEHTKQFVADNPNMNHSNMFQNADSSVNEDFFQNPEYNPDANEDDLTLLDLYRQGHLQSTDPNAPYYVTPEKLAEIEAMAKQIEEEQTPEGEADALNDKIKQPITQLEFEESTAKHAKQALDGIVKTPIDETDKTEQLDDDFGILDALVMNPVGLPSKLPTIPTPQYSSGCRTINLAYHQYSVAFPSSDQCAKLNEFKKGVGYILYILTAFGIAVAALRVND